MAVVTSNYARMHLYALMDRVAEGESITITRHGVTIATLSLRLPGEIPAAADAIDALTKLTSAEALDGMTLNQMPAYSRRR